MCNLNWYIRFLLKIDEGETDNVAGLDEEEDLELEECSEAEGRGSTCLAPQVQKVAGGKRKRRERERKEEDGVLSAVLL